MLHVAVNIQSLFAAVTFLPISRYHQFNCLLELLPTFLWFFDNHFGWKEWNPAGKKSPTSSEQW